MEIMYGSPYRYLNLRLNILLPDFTLRLKFARSCVGLRTLLISIFSSIGRKLNSIFIKFLTEFIASYMLNITNILHYDTLILYLYYYLHLKMNWTDTNNELHKKFKLTNKQTGGASMYKRGLQSLILSLIHI